MTDVDYDAAVAVIGMSGRFPGSTNVEEFWSALMAGRPGLRELDEEELVAAGVGPAQLANPSYVRTGAPIEGTDLFDAGMFGFSRHEAELMDPQHRLLLECSWEALEYAGYQPTAMPGRVGVFAGCGHPDYLYNVGQKAMAEPGGALLMAIGNERDSLASLVSYKLGLTGPSVTVQTFCSTSLVAVHMAAQSLLNFECDAALAGGAFIPLPQNVGYVYEEGGILSPDGQVHAFGAGAHGSVIGAGVSVVALKRLADALDDGDHIEAVILGSAVNNDGRACAGYTAPGVDGQAEVMEQAISFSGVRPETIGYVECHATGTPLGDSIELAALARAFPKDMGRRVVLGSLKPSIGHLDRASGTAGLIKAAMALSRRVLPATLHYENPNPVLATERDRFTVLDKHQDWPEEPQPRRAGVSSFGLGGTNAHVVLEEPPHRPREPRVAGPQLLVLSARDATALDEATRALAQYLDANPAADLADVAFTLQRSRAQFPVRRALVCTDTAQALAVLSNPAKWPEAAQERHRPVAELADAGTWTVSGQWREELREAVLRLLGDGGPAEAAGGSPTAGAAHEAFVRAMARLGCRVVAPADGEEEADAARIRLEPSDEVPAEQWLLNALGRLWTDGATVEWTATDRADARRIPLPTYPFQRRSYWVDPPETPYLLGAAEEEGRADDIGRWTYAPAWRRRHAAPADLPELVRAAGPWLVLASEEWGEALAAQARAAGGEVVVARPGPAFGGDREQGFTFRPAESDDTHRLLGALGTPPRTVVHALGLGSLGRPFEEQQNVGFDAVRALAGALALHAPSQAIDVLCLTRESVQIAGSVPRDPAQAALAALLPVLAQENPGWTCRHIDLGRAAGGLSVPAQVAAVLGEAGAVYEGPVALRGTERWVREHEPLPLAAVSEPDGPLTPGSTVLITGGLGHVGLILARHLAVARGCRVVLTGRTALPARERWKDHLEQEADPSSKIHRCVKALVEIEEAGGRVLVAAADASDAAQMRAVVENAEEHFGGLDLVVHGAGVSDAAAFGPAHMVDAAGSRSHFTAKIDGFRSLQQALGDRPVPGITMSSLSAVLGGLALGPYAAANAALDACALGERASGGRTWLTVNWDTWRPDAQDHTHSGEFDMAPQEAVEVFERAVGALDRVDHLVISTGSLPARHDRWVVRHGRDEDTGADEDIRDPRPDLSIPYVAPEPGTEQELAAMWAAVLRLDRVGADDDFFRLGGTSVVAIQLIARVRKELGIPVPTTALLGYPTVRGLAEQIDTARGEA
ncbi:hypothetical protein JCM4814A_41010 [Streptomyces phaeofaciens JCM 4814]|uniref:Polyketide synthase n=1 Tax=Streptomyces phaeofaciens TaxID=68254 RepID=A0A918LZW4_9ACTN|nr:SDR family NAD(P)-dependent oxidoreductase [Streptomyces phaeofaciens]GGT80696.1 hypothetical protein GCM10010226_69060 [Streptomyces phaeofaciens]